MTQTEINKIRLLIGRYGKDLDRRGYSWATWYGYDIHLTHFLRFLRNDDAGSLAEITPEVLHRYQMHVHNGEHRGRPVSVSTRCARLTALLGFFRWLARHDHVMSDPARLIEMPRAKKTLPRGVMTTGEVRKILNAPDVETPRGLRDRAILETLYSTGVRNAELRALCLEDVDTADGEVRVRRGKGGRERVVPLGDVAARAVEEYLRRGRPPLAAGKSSDPHLFITGLGGPFVGYSLFRRVQSYARKAGIAKHVTPHSFRHTCATHMLKGGASLRHVQEMLGHQKIDSTQIYTHLSPLDLKREHRRCHPREQARK